VTTQQICKLLKEKNLFPYRVRTSVSIAPLLQKEKCFSEGSQASPVFSSGKSSVDEDVGPGVA
jgi:hypothetical protein